MYFVIWGEHRDVVEVVVVRIYGKSRWMKMFCNFSLPAFLIIIEKYNV